ncbi:MAG: aminoglycoside phosphotransferase family protein [Bacteroidia bacterium]|nr:aminoglycoside phosphotransferase family protein [Bacteroidia bacterium]
MGVTAEFHLRKILEHFAIYGDFISARPYGSGHIHDTWLAEFSQAGIPVRYILQRVNHEVFTRTKMVCDNIARVCEHLRRRLVEYRMPDISRRCMTVIPASNGASFYQDRQGNFWRVFLFIEGTVAVDEVESTAQAYQAAYAIGEFQRYLSDLPASMIGESLPQFHHIGWRYENLEKAISENPINRLAEVQPEVDFALQLKPQLLSILDMLSSGVMPVRVTHNDTKINNVLLDISTGDGICVIDLDTVMPGSVIYDFGDMVRTFTSPSPEDETDLSKVYLRMDIFAALTEGYLASAGEFLLPIETENLVFGAKLITMIMGIRFLTDYLMGDVYYKIHHPQHNLHRCRNQFQLTRSILEHEPQMKTVVKNLVL